MPRTRKYDVNESVAGSQATIIAQVNDNNYHGRENHVTAPPVKKKSVISVGWSLGILFAALCIAFLLCVAFIKIPGVPSERAPLPSRLLRKQGYFKIYPVPVSEEDDFSTRTKIISLSNITNSIEQLRNEVNRYPSHSELYTSCFVASPTYNHPCFFDKEWLGSECTEENSFGYKEINGMINPCILLRLENTTDWNPIVYKRNEVDKSWIDDYSPTFSSVGCTILGRHNSSKQKSIKSFPAKGFPNEFFPASNFNKTLYLKPSVMLQITGLPVGESIDFQCWLRVSNAFTLEDDGEIIINMTVTDQIMSSDSLITVTEDFNTSTSTSPTEIITESTTVRRLLSTAPGLNLRGNN